MHTWKCFWFVRKRQTCMKLVTTRMMRLVKRMGPRKLKSFPFFAAQKVYAVRDPTTENVNIKASRTILPDKHRKRYCYNNNISNTLLFQVLLRMRFLRQQSE